MQMKMDKKIKKFDKNKVKKLLTEENEYILDLLSTFDVPESIEDDNLEDLYLLKPSSSNPSTSQGPTIKDFNKTNRANTAGELEERLERIKNKMQSKKNKMSDRTVKKREMKKFKKEKDLKKKLISVHKSMKNEKSKEVKIEDADTKDDIKLPKPIFNKEGKIVFSKIDFASHPGAKAKKSKKDKIQKNPKQALQNLKEQKKQIAELVEKGEKDKVQEIKQDLAWKKAFDKTEGKKIKDDPNILHKAIKKKKDKKKKSKEQWIERKQQVEQNIAAKQKKRQDNINQKMKEKKNRKLKRLSKKGRVIPGF